MGTYTVKSLAKLAGVSVRTLHVYDRMGLLRPSERTEAGYRLYGERELLRLQQILFYKELDFSLKEILAMLDDPEFDMLAALTSHRAALKARRDRLSVLLGTIDKTILKLKGVTMLKDEELYEGLPKGKEWRKEAMEKYGKDAVKRSEEHLKNLGKEGFEKLKKESLEIWQTLFELRDQDPDSRKVQEQIRRHYHSIRQFWGTAGISDNQAEAYRGLGELYVNDERFTMMNGKPHPDFALFLNKAINYYVDKSLK